MTHLPRKVVMTLTKEWNRTTMTTTETDIPPDLIHERDRDDSDSDSDSDSDDEHDDSVADAS